ncbi:MAG TPA: hypothetical protein DCE42_19185, partial [Myxococcales bacterium]|nr:hypothetical protein [Myxococcales bacterium]
MNRYRMLRVTFVFALLAASLSFVACSDNNNNNTEKTDTDGGTQKEGSTDNYPEGVECKDKVCTLTGVITESFKMTADKQWILSGGVFIGDDKAETVLTIEAGTKIYGETATIPGTLIIRRHSKIMAVGTKDAPIVFTSSKAAGSRARGDWGGVVINGLAKINPCDAGTSPCEALGEGAGKDGTGYYGGDKDDDNSGELKYVRVEFAGRTFGEKNELNGIAFQGVGSGTKISYIQVHMNKDDGVEFFGGTANFKYVLLTGIGDDNLDWTQGWRGKGQFLIAQQYDDAGDNGIEADNNDNSKDAAPRSKPMLSNL